MGLHTRTEQEILNSSFDETFGVVVTEPVRRNAGSTALEYFNPATEEKQDVLIGNYAGKIVISGTDIYVGKAAIGSAAGSAVWQIKKIDTASDIIITWADGNANFDNVMSNAASLSYS